MVIRKFKTLIGFEKPFLILEAYFFMIFSKIALTLFSFKWVASMMGELMAESLEVDNHKKKELKVISEAIKISDRNIPMETACYVQALAAKLMINRRNLKSTIYLGIRKDEEGDTRGHAWLRCGTFVVTGKERKKKYQVIATYS